MSDVKKETPGASPDSEGVVVGIDPGEKSLGFAIANNGELLHTKTLNPSEFKTLMLFCRHVEELVIQASEMDLETTRGTLLLERYINYGKPLTSSGENILMLIGALTCYFQERGWEVRLLRAIDWKQNLCAYLVNDRKFENPGKAGSLDKKFSLAAAESCWYKPFKVDHEADAACLAYLPTIKKALQKNGGRP